MRHAGQADRDTDDLEALYHDNCIDCHNEQAEAGNASGPVACGECHKTDRAYTSSWQPFEFDKSLHYRHVKSQESKCENCHHEYNEETKTLIYVKGKEAPCRDCHREQTEDNRSSFRLAAHSACIGCHRKTTREAANTASGPLFCGGCHDPERQKMIAVVDDPPRLDRGQPDFVLLSAPATELESSKLNTVPFSHIGHEQFTATCRVCHHETLAKCSDCHTLWGDDKGSNVTLQQAMHKMASEHSCVGCHNTHKSDTECAGCHDLMEQGRLTEHACNICHAGPAPPDLETSRSRYHSLDQFRPDPAAVELTFTAEEIPDTVTIGSLAKEFEPVKMPHGQIVRKLAEHIENSRIATHFHGHEDVVCQGCHHHGSIGRKPALCENCHREPFNTSDLFRPGLYGAYHRQCMGCHVSMNLPKSSDCGVCHEDKDKTALGMNRQGSNR